MQTKMSTIMLLAAAACIVPLYAIAVQLSPTVIIVAKAEDDCPFYHDGVLLDEVERHGDVVHCIYQR